MAWTNKQKQLAVRACRAAGISEEQRVDMILRNFHNAHNAGAISSTSPKLTNADFEAFMAIVERFAGEKLMHFEEGFWQRAAGDHLSRLRRRAANAASTLETHGKLAPGGQGLAGWIEKRVAYLVDGSQGCMSRDVFAFMQRAVQVDKKSGALNLLPFAQLAGSEKVAIGATAAA